MRAASFALITMAFLAVTPLRAETLSDVLATRKIPVNLFPASDLQQPITSYAVSADNSPFLLAYHDDGSGRLPPILRIVRYNEQTHELRRADLKGIEVPFHGFDTVMKQVSSICMGSALAISEADGFIAINTHISPSAGCVLVLNPDLTFSAGLWGWALAAVNENIVFEESMIHFAPIHSAKLSIYNPRQKKLIRIFPTEGDAGRQQFSEELKNHLPSAEWCAQENHSCNPDDFEMDINNVTVREQAFSFDVRMSPEGFGQEAERAVKPRTIHYTCTLKDGKWLVASEETSPAAQ